MDFDIRSLWPNLLGLTETPHNATKKSKDQLLHEKSCQKLDLFPWKTKLSKTNVYKEFSGYGHQRS